MHIKRILLMLIVSLLPFLSYAQDFWQEVYTGSLNPPTIKVSSNGVVYTISDSNLISSTDNGVNWQTKYHSSFLIGMTPFGTSPTGVIYFGTDSVRKSLDEGATWITVSYPWFDPFLWFFETNAEGDVFTETGILIGSYSFRSEDEGNTWIKIGVSGAFLNSITFTPGNITYAVYFGNLPPTAKELYKTTNKGDDWIEVTSAPDDLRSIYSTEDGTLFVTSQPSNHFYRSTDHGVTWDTVFLNQKVNDFVQVSGLPLLYITVEDSGVYRSTDNGANWDLIGSDLPMTAVTKLNIDSLGYLYVMSGPEADEQTKIYRSITPANVIVGINDNVNQAMHFNLDQNYPNPFNPVSSIKYSIPQTDHVTIRIFDILGNEAAVLVNEVKEAGEHNIQFNASDLSSGVYFYRITAGNISQVKKMTLLK